MSVYAKDASVNNNHLTQNEVHLYGSSRLGIMNVDEDMEVTQQNRRLESEVISSLS